MKNKREMKIVALCVNRARNHVCCIYSLASFQQLKEDYDLYAKEYYATDWCGSDELERTLELTHLKLTGKKFNHKGIIEGEDYDTGNVYPWKFIYNEIWEVEEVK